jgi:hypothetical protein
MRRRARCGRAGSSGGATGRPLRRSRGATRLHAGHGGIRVAVLLHLAVRARGRGILLRLPWSHVVGGSRRNRLGLRFDLGRRLSRRPVLLDLTGSVVLAVSGKRDTREQRRRNRTDACDREARLDAPHLVTSFSLDWNRTGGVGEKTSYEFKKDTAIARKQLRAQNRVESVRQGGDDPAAQLARLLVRQRALRRAERDPERERALALADLLAAVLVEHGE